MSDCVWLLVYSFNIIDIMVLCIGLIVNNSINSRKIPLIKHVLENIYSVI